MLFTAFLLSVACDFGPPPPQSKAPMIAPPEQTEAVRRKKRPKNASAEEDTGGAPTDLIEAVRYTPKRPGAFDDLSVEVEINYGGGFKDIDVTWYVDGREIISQRDETLPHRYFEQGDKVQAVVSVRTSEGEAVFEAQSVKIGNTPPRILTNPKRITRLDGLRIRAEDPDGGRVTYHISGGPPGLSIGENTGVMRYAPSKTAEGGDFDVTVIARDDSDGESEWRFSVSVSAGSESPSAKAEREERRAKAKAEAEARRAAATKETEDSDD